MKEIIGNLLKKENVRQNLSSLRQEIKDENALAEALKLLAGKMNCLCRLWEQKMQKPERTQRF